jgi:hypothetical protein
MKRVPSLNISASLDEEQGRKIGRAKYCRKSTAGDMLENEKLAEAS